MQACDLERELNGGKETPLAAEASSKAAAAWKVLMARLIRHNTTAKFLNKLAPDTPVPSTEEQGHGAGATAPAARGERARLAGVSGNAQAAAAHEAAVKNQVLDGLNEALRKLNADQAAEKKLHKVVASGRLRLRELHLQLGLARSLAFLSYVKRHGLPLRACMRGAKTSASGCVASACQSVVFRCASLRA